MNRRSYQSYGEIAANPAGELFCQLPMDLMGKMSKTLQFAYLALLTAWAKLTKTDISREELRDLINEERAKQGRKPLTDLRIITWYFAEFKKMDAIERKPLGRNLWETTSPKPVKSALFSRSR